MRLIRNPSLVTTTAILLLPLFLSLLSSPVSGRRGSIVGGWTEIKDVKNNKEVQDLGKFSVKEYNRMHHSSGGDAHQSGSGCGSDGGLLFFSEVVEAKRQVVAGFKYKLRIEAVQHGVSQMFESIVVVVPWRNESRELVEFGPYKGENNNNDIKVVGF